MTTLICNFQDIVGERINGYATLSAGEVRIGQDAPTVVLRASSPPEQVIEGEATFENVEPGAAILQLHWDRQSATLRFTVPDTTEAVYLSECVEPGIEYAPPVVAAAQRARNEAINALAGIQNFADIARDAADSASQYTTQADLYLAMTAEARDRAEAAAWKAELTTVGINAVETPPGSGLWAIGSETLTFSESEYGSGLYMIGTT